MRYDCSITNRKGCNYCLKLKIINNDNDNTFNIFDEDKVLKIYDKNKCEISKIQINYCPICGKKL